MSTILAPILIIILLPSVEIVKPIIEPEPVVYFEAEEEITLGDLEEIEQLIKSGYDIEDMKAALLGD